MAISFITVGDLRPHSVTDRPVKKKKKDTEDFNTINNSNQWTLVET